MVLAGYCIRGLTILRNKTSPSQIIVCFFFFQVTDLTSKSLPETISNFDKTSIYIAEVALYLDTWCALALYLTFVSALLCICIFTCRRTWAN